MLECVLWPLSWAESVLPHLNDISPNRPIFLSRLKQLGVERLGDRQKLANALAKAEKNNRLPAPTPIQHLKPCTFKEFDDLLVVRLLCEHGFKSHQVWAA